MTPYTYHPFRFYLRVFAFTWAFWIAAIFIKDNGTALFLMFLGLCVPAVTAVLTVMFSKSRSLKADFYRKLAGFYRIHPLSIMAAASLFGIIVALSILTSTLFGQSLGQFSFTEGFSFSVKGSSALITILAASVIEEVGWRGYGEDSIAQYFSWFTESIWFGFIWSCWHIPLFFIPGTYQAGLMQAGPGFVLNFLVSVIPLGFITTWVYVKNSRSMLACIIFHLFVNFFQEKIAMTPETKCVQTIFITIAAVIIVMTQKDMFFEKRHVGRLIEE
ncbi:CPBP family intramembrane glutamic endopeptidase [uncultured Clostridium sp.]|uniref:CPBP family intramembrane glutamic endopeptidase n=1 Tax=uncultured Clostridium sp. TaxID=59620 RepID=UPI0025E83CF6|nr:CPBP family intramembrane glutamic endopeptidase [uncultured Clostridium sp.]